MATPQYLNTYTETFSAASVGGGAHGVSLTITETEVLAGAADSKYCLLVAAYRLREPVASPATLTGPSGAAMLASHQIDDGGTPNRNTLFVAVYGAPTAGLSATCTWDFTNLDFNGRFRFSALSYSDAVPLTIAAPDTGANTTGNTTTSATVPAPSKPATIVQVTSWFEAISNLTVNTANGFTAHSTDASPPPSITLDQDDVTGSTTYATVDVSDGSVTNNMWVTVGCALVAAERGGGIYVDGAVHLA